MPATNLYIVRVKDSRTLVSINGTEVIFEGHPPPGTEAGRSKARELISQVGLRWIRLDEILKNEEGTLYADSFKVIPGPPDKPKKIRVLERLAEMVRGGVSVFSVNDFQEDEDGIVAQLCAEGFISAQVIHIDSDGETYKLNQEDLEEAKGSGSWVYPKTGERLAFNAQNFSSLFMPTEDLVLLTGAREPRESLTEVKRRASEAEDSGIGLAILWLRLVSRHGAEDLQEPARVFADALSREAHRTGDLLSDWRRSKQIEEGVSELPQETPVTAPTRAYPVRDLPEEESSVTPESPFGDRNRFWGD